MVKPPEPLEKSAAIPPPRKALLLIKRQCCTVNIVGVAGLLLYRYSPPPAQLALLGMLQGKPQMVMSAWPPWMVKPSSKVLESVFSQYTTLSQVNPGSSPYNMVHGLSSRADLRWFQYH